MTGTIGDAITSAHSSEFVLNSTNCQQNAISATSSA